MNVYWDKIVDQFFSTFQNCEMWNFYEFLDVSCIQGHFSESRLREFFYILSVERGLNSLSAFCFLLLSNLFQCSKYRNLMHVHTLV